MRTKIQVVYRFGCVMVPFMTLAKRAFIVGAAVICAGAIPVLCADTPDNPYQPIVLRNVFGIKPAPQPPPEQPITPPAPLAKVVLTGITTMFGTQAFLEITEQEQGKTPNVKKTMLREKEREGPVEIVSIDVANSQVRIRNGTVETNVTFEVAKANTGPAPANMPAAQGPGFRPSLTPPPVHSSYVPPGLGAAPGGPTIIGGNDAGRAGSSVTTYGASAPGDRPLPVRTGLQPTTTLPATGNSPSTAADLLRQSARARGIPMPPLPPSSHTAPAK